MPKVKTSKFSKRNKLVAAVIILAVAIGGAAYLISSKAATPGVPTPYMSINPGSIKIGQSVTVGIRADDAMVCTWAKGEGLVGQTVYSVNVWHYYTVSPKSSQQYSAVCTNTVTNQSGAITQTMSVTPDGQISISPSTIVQGQSTTIGIRADGAMTCTWTKGEGLQGKVAYNVAAWQYFTITPSSTQSYEAWCVNTVTGTGAAAQPVPAYVTVNPKPSAPTAPTISSATSSTKPVSVKLSWKASTDPEGIKYYYVYRSDSARAIQVSGLTYTDTNVVRRSKYTYQVSAVDNTGLEGPKSTAVTVNIK